MAQPRSFFRKARALSILSLSILCLPAGEKRHLFDLSFQACFTEYLRSFTDSVGYQVVFKATWLADVGMMSMDGSVYFDDFTSNLGNHAEASRSRHAAIHCFRVQAVYGMSIDFANSSESVVEMCRAQLT